MTIDRLEFPLPDWIAEASASGVVIETPDERMRYVIRAAQRNVVEGGGPFGAAIFNSDSGELVGLGVNLVVQNRCAILHAEIVAIMIAQRRLGMRDLGAGQASYELVTSCEPCAMCFGAVPWSGVRRLVCSATEADACAAGFDEGAKVADWPQQLVKRGIEVVEGVCQPEGAAVLKRYGGEVYNGRRT
jgi:tRNA(Arg) A34 adenosine deaminase TadA